MTSLQFHYVKVLAKFVMFETNGTYDRHTFLYIRGLSTHKLMKAFSLCLSIVRPIIIHDTKVASVI